MIFKRNIYNELIEWKKEQGKSSILVEGARRVGKSTLVENFAKENYKTYILIDFNNISAEIRDIFLNERANIDTFYLKLSLATGIKIYRRKTLLIFDEVQKFPIAREYTKYIVKDNRCDCICTGSLISIKKNTQGISIPSEERKIKIYPLDFEEFLLALNEDVRLEGIKAIVKINQPIGNGIHRTLMEFMRLYIVIGGMPQAVAKYLETKDFDKVDKIKREILGIYRDDILANGDENKYKILNIFDNIPSQLNKSYKKFILNKTLKGDRIERNVENFVFLEEAMLINRCFLCNNPNIGLNQNRESGKFKCYLFDTGLLITQIFLERPVSDNDLYRKLILNKLSINQGMFVENLVAQMLVARSHKLFYYFENRLGKYGEMEIDFIINEKNKIAPIEVKSGKYNKHSSIDKFVIKYSGIIRNKYIIYTNDYLNEGGYEHLPLYYVPFKF